MNESSQQKVHILSMFDVDDLDQAKAYFRFAIEKLPTHGGQVIAMGRFRANVMGDIAPRQFYVLVEWESEEVYGSYMANAALAEAHSDREDSTSNGARHLFDGVVLTDPDFRFDELLPLLEP
jgi:uncharacterized protein (DUF1330 family)